MAVTGNKIAYAGSSSAAITLASLASGSARESVTIANTTTLDADYLVTITFTLASGSPNTNPFVSVYANGSVDAALWPILQGSAGATKATGAGDASLGALGTPPGLKLIGQFGMATNSSTGERTFRTQPFSVGSGFQGTLPPAFSIVVDNETGVAFSTSTVSSAQYLELNGVYSTSGN